MVLTVGVLEVLSCLCIRILIFVGFNSWGFGNSLVFFYLNILIWVGFNSWGFGSSIVGELEVFKKKVGFNSWGFGSIYKFRDFNYFHWLVLTVGVLEVINSMIVIKSKKSLF